jgi:hypothetical protein
VEQVQQEYQDQYNEIMQKHGLDYLNGARAGMVVCSMVFQYHYAVAKEIDPYIATGIVAMGVVEGAKTAPPPLGTPKKQTQSEKNNNRLVLGEQAAAAQEARDNGGVFIEINPAVLQTLRNGNIDPYVIYEKALINQIDAQISRIDFVGTNVDELLQSWSRKPQTETPIHVRLAQWLKVNAKTHGYELNGNSWVLK